jgi:2-phosphosulfolactate phosphatase
MNPAHDIYCEWGLDGIKNLSPIVDVIIIVDILSFSTSVDIALGRGANIFPFAYKDERAGKYAEKNDAVLASPVRSHSELSLSPSSLKSIQPGTKLLLPSPNGSELSLAAADKVTLTSCFRNCKAVAEYAMSLNKNIGVIPAGEKWKDGTLRTAMEDYIGAGAVISFLKGKRSETAEDAELSFKGFWRNLYDTIKKSVSGIELVDMGFPEDVSLACEYNVSEVIPLLQNGIYSNANHKNS